MEFTKSGHELEKGIKNENKCKSKQIYLKKKCFVFVIYKGFDDVQPKRRNEKIPWKKPIYIDEALTKISRI